jgi:hypothetical protein
MKLSGSNLQKWSNLAHITNLLKNGLGYNAPAPFIHPFKGEKKTVKCPLTNMERLLALNSLQQFLSFLLVDKTKPSQN